MKYVLYRTVIQVPYKTAESARVRSCPATQKPVITAGVARATCRRGTRELNRTGNPRLYRGRTVRWGTAVQVYEYRYEYSYAPTVRDLRYMYRDLLAKYFLHVEY